MGPATSDHNKRVLTLTVLTLSGFHCISLILLKLNEINFQCVRRWFVKGPENERQSDQIEKDIRKDVNRDEISLIGFL